MKQFVTYLLLTVLGLVFLSGCQAQKAIIRGPEGEIAYKVTLPDGFDPTKDQCLFNARFDPKDPPEYIRCWGLYSWGANTSSPRSSSTSMARLLPTRARCSSSMATATASCRCGAASDTWRPTALMPP